MDYSILPNKGASPNIGAPIVWGTQFCLVPRDNIGSQNYGGGAPLLGDAPMIGRIG